MRTKIEFEWALQLSNIFRSSVSKISVYPWPALASSQTDTKHGILVQNYAREIVLKRNPLFGQTNPKFSFWKKNYYDKIFFFNRHLRFGIKPITVPRNMPDKFFYLEKFLQNSFMQVISPIVQANSLVFVRFAPNVYFGQT